MQNFEKIFNMENQKNADKIDKALTSGYGKEYLADFLREARSQGAQDLPKAKATLTENYVCSYLDWKRQLVIIPLADVVNVYRSNSFYGKYSYDTKGVAIELLNNNVFYFSKTMKRQNIPEVETLLRTLKNVSARNAENAAV